MRMQVVKADKTKSMEVEKKRYGFDVEYAIRYAEDYYNATGFGCFLINNSGETVHITGKQDDICGFCKKLQKEKAVSISCPQVHLYGGYQAERFGGKYIFFCPVGLVHWASPIIVDGMMQGSILGGPVLVVDPDEYLMDDIIKKYGITGSLVNDLRQDVKKIPVTTTKKVSSLAEILSLVCTHLSAVSPSDYLETKQFLEQQDTISEYIHLLKSMGGGDEPETDHYPLQKEKELLNLISRGDKTGAKQLLNEILGHVFFSSGRKFEIVKARVLELVVLLSRAALEGGAAVDEIFGLNYKYINQVHSFTSVEQLATWLSKIMIRFTDLVFDLQNVKHVDVIYKTMEYVRENYMDKISLAQVSANVHISPSYFSKVFKEEMGRNFNTYLNEVRIDNSKRYLLDDTIPLVNVAFLCGYEDQSYFSKVFKKMTGMSPGKYRETMGKMYHKGDTGSAAG